MTKRVLVLVLFLGTATAAFASRPRNPAPPSLDPPHAPEIHADSAITALTILSGAVLMLRGRKK